MSKEELKKEAEEYAEQCYGWCNNDQVTDVAIATYITSAESREKRIAELEAQIEKMKCCENCQHWEGREPIPSLAEKGYYCFNDYPFECKRWELAEELKEIKEND